ncbi:MAG: efflux RND transporter periplasmic adaptor subunit [Rhodopseudomonas palustris]|uniref:Efflux RND transporter periplasmic adaptor subunit n=1 Tax=Rhodopseudomonas palustris TaxID=1076 RepID=A0A933W2L5_RHOPL|nr:efflux RND transporter periplasmic adaptor subunit [Rhodopseudomonas palustris]
MSMDSANGHAPRLFRRSVSIVALAALCAMAQPAAAADEPEADAIKGQAVTVLKATKSCFPAIVEVSGFLIPRDEISIRPDRPGARVTDVMADAGEIVAQGQTLAKLAGPEGGSTITAPVAGLVSSSTAVIGSPASAKGEALFTIISRSEFDLVGQVPTRNLSQLAVNQTAAVKIVGTADDIEGRVRRVSATVEPNSQLANVFVGVSSAKRLLSNASGRAMIKTGESCGISVPLTAVLYSSAGTVVQVVRRQTVETKRVEVGLMNGGNVEIREGLQEGDTVVARAGALLREGDTVRPVVAAAESTAK